MKYTHAIIYVGAPYGDNESGHIVSRHTREDLAEQRFWRESNGGKNTFYLNHQIVPLNDDGTWSRTGPRTSSGCI